MSRRLKIVIAAAVLTGAFLRFWRLGSVPPSLSWDEAALGYNGYAILKTGRDEWGASWPLTLRPFNDFKPALYAYAAMPSLAIFGLTAWAVRFPSALAGTVAVALMPFLSLALFQRMLTGEEKRQRLGWLAAVSTWLLAVSPWHLQFSRGAFEANLALTLFLLGLTCFLWFEKRPWLLAASSLFFGFSLYAYHAPRLLLPLWLAFLVVLFRERLGGQRRWAAVSLGLLIIIALPLVRVYQYGGLFGRAAAVKIDAGASGRPPGFLNAAPFEFGRQFISGYLAHFNPDFLVLKAGAREDDPAGRHHAVATGVMLWVSLPFFLYGLYRLGGARGRGKKILFYWLLIGPLPAALTREAPHAIRSLLILPAPQLVTGWGLVLAVDAVKSRQKWFVAATAMLFSANVLFYLHQYHVHTPREWSRYWQYGYREAVAAVEKRQAAYERVVVTRKYDQPYIFFLFYGRVDPGWYQRNGTPAGFGRYRFADIDVKKADEKTLFVAGNGEVDEKGRVLEVINFLDGSEAFRLVDFPLVRSEERGRRFGGK
jgi:4-amino-4-deoxy-L-arabinose transferase-like glycosyltransferase